MAANGLRRSYSENSEIRTEGLGYRKDGKLGFEGAKDVTTGSEIIIYVNEKILALPAGVVKIKPAIIESN